MFMNESTNQSAWLARYTHTEFDIQYSTIYDGQSLVNTMIQKDSLLKEPQHKTII